MDQTLLQKVMRKAPLDEMGNQVEGGEHLSRTIGLFHGEFGQQPLQAADRPVIRASDGVRNMLLTGTPLHGMNFYAAEFDAGGSTGMEVQSPRPARARRSLTDPARRRQFGLRVPFAAPDS